ncbi:MAG: sialidase family protein [Thermoplasmatota archaeon]
MGTTNRCGEGDGALAVEGSGKLDWLGLHCGNSTAIVSFPSDAIPFQTSSDGGATFSAPVDVSGGTGYDREWLDATSNGCLVAAWKDTQGYFVNVSPDGGTHWRGKVQAGADGTEGPVLHDPSDPSRLYIPQSLAGTPDATGYFHANATLTLMRSRDGGATWTTLRIRDERASPADCSCMGYLQGFPVAAADAAGNLYVVAAMKQDVFPAAAPHAVALFGVDLFVSNDDGASWAGPELFSTPLKDAIMPWVSAGLGGRIAVTWYENTLGTPNDYVPDVWNVRLMEGLHMQAAGQVRNVTTVNVAPSHLGAVCTGGIFCAAGGDRSLSDVFQNAIAPGGQPVVAWASSTGGTGVNGLPQPSETHARVALHGTPMR